MSIRSLIRALGLTVCLIVPEAYLHGETSELWGVEGELWSPAGRLPDFSFAGYHSGNDPIPDAPIVANVIDFGAVGDGMADDSDAFLAAIASAHDGAVYIPPGRYRITKVLKINKSNIVLRGAGASETILYFPMSLRQALGPAPEWAGNSGSWSWGGGWIWFEGREAGEKLSDVAVSAARGDYVLELANVSGVSRGMMVRVVQNDTSGSLGRSLHAGYLSAGSAAPSDMVDWVSRVAAVSGNRITLERPLRVDVRPEWDASVFSYAPTVEESGLEDLTIEFPNSNYPGHLNEDGYNAILLDGVSNCWIRNITILDADSGVLSVGPVWGGGNGIARFCTLKGIRLANQWRTSNVVSGHHGIAWEGPQDNLVQDFQFDKMFMHDVTVDWVSTGNVFSAGSGVNMNFDHHRYTPYANLFTEIDVGPGSQLWYGSRTLDSGNADGGPPSGAWETFWNISATNAMALPDWPAMNVIGMIKFPTQKTNRLWVEQIDPLALSPSNLYEAQLVKRLSGITDKRPTPPSHLTVE